MLPVGSHERPQQLGPLRLVELNDGIGEGHHDGPPVEAAIHVVDGRERDRLQGCPGLLWAAGLHVGPGQQGGPRECLRPPFNGALERRHDLGHTTAEPSPGQAQGEVDHPLLGMPALPEEGEGVPPEIRNAIIKLTYAIGLPIF